MYTSLSKGSARGALHALVLMTASCLATQPAASAASKPPYIPIDRQYYELPKDMQPQFPIFISDGREILFQDEPTNTVWIIASDGSNLQCITCDFDDRPNTRGGGFAYAFPDGKRLLLTHGLARGIDSGPDADAWVLECAPSIRNCASHRFLPIDMSADRGTFAVMQRRTWHLAPDGVHLGWMEVRPDGTLMIVARLERETDKYVAADPRVVNPAGPTSSSDDNADRWENLSQLYELKSFTPDGKGVLAVGLPNNNVDVIRIELATGHTARLTAHTDWDEDASLSPDQSLFVVNSWRGRDRLDAIAWIPQIRGFTGLMMGAALAPFYVSTWTGFQCDLSPWLLPARGDDDGQSLGQPLDIYDGELTAANNLAGQQVWSPDSTMVLLQERTRTKGVWSPNRIAIARLGREPTRPVSVVSSTVGAWAPSAKLYRGPNAEDRTVVVRGKAGGKATITYKGTLGAGPLTAVVFDRFTDDGATFVTGTMSASAEKRGSGEKRSWILLADVAVTGRHTGKLQMDLNIDNTVQPLPNMTGAVKAVYDGKVAPPLPALAPCYDALPKASPLRLELKRTNNGVRATVTADVYGDIRPVANATLRHGASSIKTNDLGQAMLSIAPNEQPEIVVTAGDTFTPTRAAVPGQ
ncbi:hypothetical protein GCM10011487_44230 [Steroidobacter agaridevorans]|uniref:Uncharacterized protein n=1 Tax=Steroidobacter agaridevorans TaxID=2695856 RepID=A0A829YHR1_9GAMM|nr:hypothetical protein [Steroidobacter agaridevorans]GFE82423.1 hypothetical protein GCM10011487_44230 [Steroidobacter agaridevorans]